MVPVFLATGSRVVAPDLFGFGRSDKPTRQADYSFDFHRNSLLRLIERLDLRDVTLVVQDWGGLLGLTLPVEAGMADRFSRLLIMNTTLATGEPPSPGFAAWRSYAADHPNLDVGALIRRATPHLTEREIAAYNAPFPDETYKAGVQAFPTLVMTDPAMVGVAVSRAALEFWSERWGGRSFMAWGGADPVFGVETMESLHTRIRGCPSPFIIPDAGHFLQEWGEDIARRALAWFDGR